MRILVFALSLFLTLSLHSQAIVPAGPSALFASQPVGPGAYSPTMNTTNPSVGNCVVWLPGPLLGDAPCTTVVGQAGAGVLASAYKWQQSPLSPVALSVGMNVITLSPCPLGLFINSTQYTPTQYVYIAGTGVSEAALATRVSGHSGDPSCQISMTTGAHGAGYTVGTASGGIKEASEAARNPVGRTTEINGGLVYVDEAGAPYRVYAPLHFESSYQDIVGAGGRIECYVSGTNGWKDDDCIVVGSRASAILTQNVVLDGLIIHAANGNTVNYAFDAIHVNAQSTVVRNPRIIYSASSLNGEPTGSFNSYVSVCDDEAFTLDGVDVTDSHGLRGDRVGQAVYALPEGHTRNSNNCFAVGWLRSINGNMQCGGNVIRWLSGNGLHINDSVIQGFSQFGILTGAPTGGFNPNTQIDNAYYESNCTNPDYVAAGAAGFAAHAQAGVLTQGGNVNARGSTGFTGAMPMFACSGAAGSTAFNYWVVPNQSGAGQGNGGGAPLYIGNTAATCSGTVTGYFPSIPGAVGGMILYDVIRSTGVGANLVVPYTAGCAGGAVNTCGSVVVGKAVGGGTVETFTDDVSLNTTAYAVPAFSFVPYLPFWPGNLILSAAFPTNRTQVPVATFAGEMNLGGGNGVGIINVNSGSVASTWSLAGTNGPLGTPDVHLGGWNTATLLFRGAQANSDGVNMKGRLNFIGTSLSGFNAGSIITLVDSNPDKTTSTPTFRPVMDAADVWIGEDNPGFVNRFNVPLAFGAPTMISFYINSLPDGASWKARLTGSSFAIPGGSAGHATCWKNDGKTIGFCSTAIAADGTCTCN